jgi:hypothetical protein
VAKAALLGCADEVLVEPADVIGPVVVRFATDGTFEPPQPATGTARATSAAAAVVARVYLRSAVLRLSGLTPLRKAKASKAALTSR